MSWTKKTWVLAMEFFLCAMFAVVGLALRLPKLLRRDHGTCGSLLLVAQPSTCAYGIYITALDEKKQAEWIGLQGGLLERSAIFCTAAVVWFACWSQTERRADGRNGWHLLLLGSSSILMGLLGVHPSFPPPPLHRFPLPGRLGKRSSRKFADSVADPLSRKSRWWGMLSSWIYRTGEGFLLVEGPRSCRPRSAEGGLGSHAGAEGADRRDGLSTLFIRIAGGLGGTFVAKFGLRWTLLFSPCA